MDNPIQAEIENYIEVSRVRTKRRRIRDAREHFEKQLLALRRQQDGLWKTWQQRGYVPLEPPVMKGYKRYFVLRDDVARGKQAGFYEQLLKKINTYDYSHRKDFKVKKRSHGRKKMILREQYVLAPDLEHFKKLQFTDREATCFEERIFFQKNSLVPVRRMVFKEPWRFVLRIRPNMITETRMILPEVQSQIRVLKNYEERHHLWHKIQKLKEGNIYRFQRWRNVEKGKYIFKHKTLQQLLQEE
jgi:hypothetical protein